MVAFGHTAIGAVIGVASYQAFGDEPIGLIYSGAFGFISHYLADSLPHGHFFDFKQFDKKVGYVIVLDLLLSILFFLWLVYSKDGVGLKLWFVIFGIGGSQLPDVLEGLMFKKVLPIRGLLKLEFNIHQSMHWHGRLEKALLWSKWDIWQVMVFLAGVIYILQ